MGGAPGANGLLMEGNRKGRGAAQTPLQEMEERSAKDQRKKQMLVLLKAVQVKEIQDTLLDVPPFFCLNSVAAQMFGNPVCLQSLTIDGGQVILG